MKDLRRIAIAAAVLALVSALAYALPASGRTHGRAPAAHGRSEHSAVYYYLRPTRVGPPLGACVAAGPDDNSAFSLGLGQMDTTGQLPVTVSTAGVPSG